jgi:HAD superfamily hydrolase (TIGR01509 family)
MMALRALLWDLDGTLVESEELHRQAFNDTFAEAGFGWHWSREEYHRLLGVAGGQERIQAYLEWRKERDVHVAVADLHRLKTKRFQALLADTGVRPRPGVIRLLREAQDHGLLQAIVTTTSRSNVQTLLDTMFKGVLRRWDAVLAGDSVQKKKPAPDIYRLALERLGLPASACLALEDSAIGVSAARAVGVPVMVTQSMYTETDDFSGALTVLDHLGERDQPMRIISGPAPHEACMTVAGLRRLHARA